MLGSPQAAQSHTASGWALGQALQEVHCTKPRHLGLKPVPALGETEELVFSSPAALGCAYMHGAGGAGLSMVFAHIMYPPTALCTAGEEEILLKPTRH